MDLLLDFDSLSSDVPAYEAASPQIQSSVADAGL